MEENKTDEKGIRIFTDENTNCRICFDIGLNPLIHACRCIGTLKFVHEVCLKQWIVTKYSEVDGAKCEVCLYKYSMVIEKKSKCSARNALLGTDPNLCVMFTSFILLVTMTVIFVLFLKEEYDLKNKKAKSISIAAICGTIMLVCIVVLIRSVYHVMFYVSISRWSIVPMEDKVRSISSI